MAWPCRHGVARPDTRDWARGRRFLESGRLNRTGDQLSTHETSQSEGGPPRVQVRLLAAAGGLGAALLAASLAVDLTGANDATAPTMPTLSSLPTSLPTNLPTSLPTSLPSLPDEPGSTDLPTDLPSLDLPSLPTDLPSMPDLSNLSGGDS